MFDMMKNLFCNKKNKFVFMMKKECLRQVIWVIDCSFTDSIYIPKEVEYIQTAAVARG
jgi:hypothetical protein